MYKITYNGPKEKDSEYPHDKYMVVSDSVPESFVGTYAQCLIYVGALEISKDHNLSAKFARLFHNDSNWTN